MNNIRNENLKIPYLESISIVMLFISLILLSIIAWERNLGPIILYLLLNIVGIVLIFVFSHKYEILLKIKLFIIFFSLYLIYALINYYILLNYVDEKFPFSYFDESTFYQFSFMALPYISGEKNFFDLFSFAAYPMHDLSLHVMFSALIAYFSIAIDGSNTIMVQKLLSPFFGGLFIVVLYSTLKYQFKDQIFALNATVAYGLISVIFMYSTPLLRDIDIALAYMIAIYLFLQKNHIVNFLLLLIIAYTTIYLRTESGLVLYALALLYAYFNVRKLESRSIKLIFYILLMVIFSFVLLMVYNKIIGMIIDRNESNLARSIALASTSSLGLLLNKLPFPLSYVAKVLFGQIQPFPFFIAIDRPPEAISGIFWPFIFIMMLYGVIKKNIRVLIDIKIKYLLVVAIAILFLMSSEPQARRMMSVYPIIYITSLYVFFLVPQDRIKRAFLYYIFGILSLNTFYFLIKL